MKHYLLIILSFFFSSAYTYSLGTSGSSAFYETLRIVDMPTAGIIPKNSFAVRTNFYNQGGLNLAFAFAPFNRFNIEASYGGNGIVGSSEVVWQKLPGLSLKYRILNERLNLPAIVMGFSNQGFGTYFRNDERFSTHSPGFFISVSKSYKTPLGYLGLHAGANYSFDSPPEHRSPNIFIGLEQSIGKYVALNVEHNFNFDDSDINYIESKGLLNANLRFSLSEGVTFETQFRDILQSQKNNNSVIRFFVIELIQTIN